MAPVITKTHMLKTHVNTLDKTVSNVKSKGHHTYFFLVILTVCETKSIMSTATTNYTEAEAQVHALTPLTDTAERPGTATNSADLKQLHSWTLEFQ